ncbi:Dihydropteroate synthase [Salinivirga cyanobacteriivorans]|uniref:dihydropteroate synthase n=1 Tax=Salinivirga cyanobacteriivorans TaxID=1307839 RepID=A0A0S2HUR8_9BACT|nr:dihydropteroate synthase [Salinivirga cyanobacteriivorans]ALO13710.1 Dihydropteroate synthase [Salinivirga cyanobacteriivorans]
MKQTHSIKIHQQLVNLDRPYIMAVLNVTPDSFYEGSRVTPAGIEQRVAQIISEGADWIDVGGYSSRPGADDISPKTEKERLMPALDMLASEYPQYPVSVDTFRADVANWAIENYNVAIINDISGGHLDPEILEVAGQHGVPYIGMHMRGTPQNMQQQTHYDDILRELTLYFAQMSERASSAGISDLIIDPGFGFAKTIDDNYLLLQRLRELLVLKKPILVGMSRKSMIYKPLNIRPEDSLHGTIALHTIALQNGASIIRVHDVSPAYQMAAVVNKTQKQYD